MKKVIFLLSMYVLPVTGYTQKKLPGYIIKTTGDTLWGDVKYDFYGLNGSKIFIYDKLGYEHIYKKTEIIGLGQTKKGISKHYIKFKVATNPLLSTHEFLEALVIGKISVYIFEWEKGSGRTGTKYYLQNTEGKTWIVEMEVFSYNKNTLKEAFAECADVLQKIKGVISDKEIISLATDYNNCNNQHE